MRFHGVVGYGSTVEQANGVYADQITEVECFGDVVRNLRQLQEGENLNRDLSVSNSISIVGDSERFFDIRYVQWKGVRWSVTGVEISPPRLILALGEVYNGPIPDGASEAVGESSGE